MLPWPIWREAFINDADEELARSSYEQLSPEPYRCFTDKLDLGAFYASQIPRSYLNCTEDIALPPGEVGLAPAVLGPARALPARPDAGQPRGRCSRTRRCWPQKLVEAGRD